MIMRENVGVLCRGKRELAGKEVLVRVVSTGLGQAESQAAMLGVAEAADHWKSQERVPGHKLMRHSIKRIHPAKTRIH